MIFFIHMPKTRQSHEGIHVRQIPNATVTCYNCYRMVPNFCGVKFLQNLNCVKLKFCKKNFHNSLVDFVKCKWTSIDGYIIALRK